MKRLVYSGNPYIVGYMVITLTVFISLWAMFGPNRIYFNGISGNGLEIARKVKCKDALVEKCYDYIIGF